MTTPNRKPTTAAPVAPIAPIAEWSWLFLAPLLQAQRLQLHALLCWQQTITAFNKDVWEQWAVRYAGGMPIDG